MIQIYYGDGKGKSSAAAGAAIRAAGAGYAILFVVFMKGRFSSERALLGKMEGVTLFGLHHEYPFFKDMSEEDRARISLEHEDIFSRALQAYFEYKKKGKKILVVFDELLHALNHGLVCEKEVEDFILREGADSEIVITGRSLEQGILWEAADYVTEMKKRKHPFDVGVRAREGIEY